MKIEISKELYSKNVLLKACYKYTDNYYIHLYEKDEKYFVEIDCKNENDNNCIDKEFNNELLEQANRELVVEETKNIREMLFARAMASSVIYDDVQNDINVNINDDTAMKDWFANE